MVLRYLALLKNGDTRWDANGTVPVLTIFRKMMSRCRSVVIMQARAINRWFHHVVATPASHELFLFL